jgi:hypothetical protein
MHAACSCMPVRPYRVWGPLPVLGWRGVCACLREKEKTREGQASVLAPLGTVTRGRPDLPLNSGRHGRRVREDSYNRIISRAAQERMGRGHRGPVRRRRHTSG